MSVRPAITCFRLALLRVSRSPLVLASMLLYLAALATLPKLTGDDRGEIHRQSAAWQLSVGTALLLVVALSMPVWRGAIDQRRRDARFVGRVSAAVAHAFAALITLVALASGFAMLGYGWERAAHGNPEAPMPTPVSRDLLGANDARVVLDPAHRRAVVGLNLTPAAGVKVAELVLAPRVALLELPESEASSVGDGVEITWGPEGRRGLRTARFEHGRGTVVPLPIGEGLAGARHIELTLRLTGRGQRLIFEPRSMFLLGLRTRLLPSLVRAFLCVALAVGVLSVVLQWFSGFVSAPIAVAAVLTGVVASIAVVALNLGSDGLQRMVAPWGPDDVGAMLRAGFSVGWPTLAPAAMRFLVVALTMAALAWVPLRREREARA